MEQNKQELLEFYLKDALPVVRNFVQGKYALKPKTGDLRRDVYYGIIDLTQKEMMALMFRWFPNLIDIFLERMGYKKAVESPTSPIQSTGGTSTPPVFSSPATEMPDMSINVPQV